MLSPVPGDEDVAGPVAVAHSRAEEADDMVYLHLVEVEWVDAEVKVTKFQKTPEVFNVAIMTIIEHVRLLKSITIFVRGNWTFSGHVSLQWQPTS